MHLTFHSDSVQLDILGFLTAIARSLVCLDVTSLDLFWDAGHIGDAIFLTLRLLSMSLIQVTQIG